MNILYARMNRINTSLSLMREKQFEQDTRHEITLDQGHIIITVREKKNKELTETIKVFPLLGNSIYYTDYNHYNFL